MTRAAMLVIALGLALGACSSAHHVTRPDGIDVSSYPDEIQDAYDVFAFRCSRCHSLARPLNAQVTDPEHWDDYVARMRRQPGSGINRHNARQVLKFLYYYTQQRTGAGGGT